MAWLGTLALWLGLGILALLALVLALVLIALILPIQAWAQYADGQPRVWVKVLFIRITLLPKRNRGAGTTAKKRKKAGKLQTGDRPANPTDPAAAAADLTDDNALQDAVCAQHAADAGQTATPAQADKRKKRSQKAAAAKADKNSRKDKDGKKAGNAADADKKKKSGFDWKRWVESLPEVLEMAGRFIRAVFRALHFKHIRLLAPIAGGEPDKVARNVGRANAWFFGVISQLQPRLHISLDEVRFYPDYTGEHKGDLTAQICVGATLLPFVIAALYLFFGLKKQKLL